MLTIENVHKAYRMDVAGYRIGKVESTPTAYLFYLYKPHTNVMNVGLTRNGTTGQSGEPEYTMWCQTGGKNVSLNFVRKDFLTPAAFLMALHVLIV